MCFTVSIYASTHVIETGVGALFEDEEAYQPFFRVSGFVHPSLPVVANDDPSHLRMMEWGLIPRWTKDHAKADELRNMTLNARCETIFEKPSFRDAIAKRRALLPVNGFVEWRHEGKQKIPHYIRMHNSDIFTLGCIWEEWTDRGSGEHRTTFSIVTTEANELMSYIHNTKQRMPLVIEPHVRTHWLATDDRAELASIMRPLADGQLEADVMTTGRSKSELGDNDLEPNDRT